MTQLHHVYFKRLRPEIHKPTHGSERAAALDLYMPSGGVLFPHETHRVDMGIVFELPPGHMGLILPRTSTGLRNVTTVHPPIDEDFRGELSILLTNTSSSYFSWKEGDRLVQMVVIPIPVIVAVEVDEVSMTARGEGKFGSTGR